MAPMVDWSARMREMADFVGLGAADLELIRTTAPLILPRAEDLTAAVYDHFLEFPGTARFFLTEGGEVDEERLTRRRHSLLRWLRASISPKIDEEFPISILAAGLVHSHPPTHRAHLGSIPSRFMIGTISFVQTALAEALLQELDDPVRAMAASGAWNKLLMAQLDLLLAGYVTEVPLEPVDPVESEPEPEPATGG